MIQAIENKRKEKKKCSNGHWKDLANRHFEVIWRYENMTNSIMVRLEKRFDLKWYKLERRIGFETYEIQHALFEFCMFKF